MIDFAFLPRARMRNELFGVFVCFFIFGGNDLHHSTDNRSLTQCGFLGTYEDPNQDVTV